MPGRSLGVVAGNTGASGPAPCERLRDRLVGLHDQCRKLADRKVPFHPRENDDQRADYAGVVRGEVSWVEGQSGPDTAAWIPTLVLPEDAPLTIATRRDVGSAAVQPDGFVGSVLLDETELVLDYTEDEDKPGVRVTCLEPSAGDCLGMPSCTSEGEDTSSAAPGKDACCWGVPDELLEQIVLEGLGEDAPRESDRCCDALAPDTRTALEEMELCSG